MCDARRASRDIDARTDLYALGAMLFTFVTGRYVHPTSNPMERMIRAATDPAPAVLSVRPDLPSSLADTIDIALSFRREHRWPSARAMRDALAGGG